MCKLTVIPGACSKIDIELLATFSSDVHVPFSNKWERTASDLANSLV